MAAKIYYELFMAIETFLKYDYELSLAGRLTSMNLVIGSAVTLIPNLL